MNRIIYVAIGRLVCGRAGEKIGTYAGGRLDAFFGIHNNGFEGFLGAICKTAGKIIGEHLGNMAFAQAQEWLGDNGHDAAGQTFDV